MTFEDYWRAVRNTPWVQKLIMPVIIGLVLMVGVLICVYPFIPTGGAIYNSNMTLNIGFDMDLSGYGWGSRTVYAREGQTVEVEIDVHEISEGGIYARLSCSGWVNKKEWKSLNIRSVGKHTITLVASQPANYKVEFEPLMSNSGQCDLTYSATWDAR